MKIKLALISVHDKSGIVDFAREIQKLGIEIIATSGTYRVMKEAGIGFIEKVSDVTEFPEILEGRLKTEHPKIIGGILALKDKEEHMKELKRLGIKPVDMVVCDLHQFDGTVNQGVDLKSALDSIDVGGPNMIRAAAKNLENVVVIVNPCKYDLVIRELSKEGDIRTKTRLLLAKEAFKLMVRYDLAIQKFFEKKLQNFGK
jgi:phosphoribosylaminoimidazolecarboxamide formyltransferase/IMP cyclohydrolase